MRALLLMSSQCRTADYVEISVLHISRGMRRTFDSTLAKAARDEPRCACFDVFLQGASEDSFAALLRAHNESARAVRLMRSELISAYNQSFVT